MNIFIMKTTATKQTVLTAIDTINRDHGYRIELNRADQSGKWFNFTIKSKSGIPGARKSTSGRNLAAASWHAHGYLFDEIFKLDPIAIIWSSKHKITVEAGNWINVNIGSAMFPCYFSKTSIL